MKIKYDMTDNYKNIYNESQGIFKDIKKIKNNKDFKIITMRGVGYKVVKL